MKFFRIKYTFILWGLAVYFALWIGLLIDEIFGNEFLSWVSNNYEFALMMSLTMIPVLALWICISHIASNQFISKTTITKTFE